MYLFYLSEKKSYEGKAPKWIEEFSCCFGLQSFLDLTEELAVACIWGSAGL